MKITHTEEIDISEWSRERLADLFDEVMVARNGPEAELIAEKCIQYLTPRGLRMLINKLEPEAVCAIEKDA